MSATTEDRRESVVEGHVSGLSGATTPPALTPRQRECLRLRALGLTNPEVAHRLGIGEQAVKNQVSSILRRLEVATVVEALTVVGWLVVPGADAYDEALRLREAELVEELAQLHDLRSRARGGIR